MGSFLYAERKISGRIRLAPVITDPHDCIRDCLTGLISDGSAYGMYRRRICHAASLSVAVYQKFPVVRQRFRAQHRVRKPVRHLKFRTETKFSVTVCFLGQIHDFLFVHGFSDVIDADRQRFAAGRYGNFHPFADFRLRKPRDRRICALSVYLIFIIPVSSLPRFISHIQPVVLIQVCIEKSELVEHVRRFKCHAERTVFWHSFIRMHKHSRSKLPRIFILMSPSVTASSVRLIPDLAGRRLYLRRRNGR